MSKRKIVIPPQSRPMAAALKSDQRTVLIEHAPVKGPRKGLLAWFLASAATTAVPDRNFVWVSTYPAQAKDDVAAQVEATWLKRWWKPNKRNPDTLGRDGSRLWYVKPQDLDTLPISKAQVVVIENAHLIDDDPTAWLGLYATGKVRIFGWVANQDHWFGRAFADAEARNDGTAFRVTLNDEVERGSVSLEQAAAAKAAMGEEQYRQHYLLERKSDKKWSGGDFITFCRQRCFITTDKDQALLSPLQQQYAKDQPGVPLVPFDPTPLQLHYQGIKDKVRRDPKLRNRYLLLKYRQGGFTTDEQAENYHVICTQPRSKVVTLAHTDESTGRIFEIAQNLWRNDPFAPPQRTIGNARKIHLAQNDSQFFIATAGAKGIGRGFTLQRVHGSEVSQWGSGSDRVRKVQDIMGGLLPAAKNGEVVLETTPNGVEWFAQAYKEARESRGRSGWWPIFLPWFIDPLNRLSPEAFDPEEVRETLTSEERELISMARDVHGVELDVAMIAFRRFQKNEAKVLFPQEYPEDDESCFLTSGTPYFDLVRADLLVKFWERNYRDAGKRSYKAGHEIVIWEEPQPGRSYVIGADTSEGLPQSDPNGFVVKDKKTGETVADYHGRAKIRDQAAHLYDMHKRYNGAMVGVENNNHGHAVLALLTDKYGMTGGVDGDYQTGKLYHHSNGRPGWTTDSVTRPVMLSTLSDAVQDRDTGWKSRNFLSELFTFKLQDDGKFSADPGAHDDDVMKNAIAEEMRALRVKPGPGISFAELY